MESLNTFLIILFLASISAVQSSHSFPINVWPKPTSFAWDNPYATTLSPNFSISSPAHTNLNAAVRRYQKQLLTERHRPLVTPLLNLSSNSQPLTALNVAVTDVNVPLGHGFDESYTLVVPCDGGVAELKAETAWGAMRGLETLSQLVYAASGSGSSSTVTPSMVGCGLQISDTPLFSYRGVMLDTSRNYYTIKDLKRLVRTISMNKLNVFHWHVTDSHSFPLELSSEPTLAQKGSYGEYMTYTVDDVKKLIGYAMDRGVRIIPEIDMPGHTGSWAKAYPEIVTCAGKFWSPTDSGPLAAEPGTGQLNPLHPKTYQVVQNLINDVVSMFPDTFYHAGADEINPNCWKTDPSIQDYLSKNGTLSQILETFVNATLPQIVSLNRTVVYWEDVLLSPNINVRASLLPSENVVLQTWNNGPNNTKTIVSSGYRAIVSSSDYYYLDCGHGDFLGNVSDYNQPPGTPQGQGGSWCGPFKTWQLIYNYDITYGLSEDESKLVLGGEVALWSEQADGNVMDARVWPRASAMGEALWSGNRDETGNSRCGEATDRLNEWRHRMVSRGIRVEPIQPLWCLMNPGMCNAAAS